MEAVFVEALKRLAAKEETEVELDGWRVQSSTVGETFLGNLLPVEQNKRIALLKKSTGGLQNVDDSSDHNGDVSLSEEKDYSNCSLSSEMNGCSLDNSLLTIEDARVALSMYTMLHSPIMNANNSADQLLPLLPLWIQCDGKDPERTGLIGCEQAQTGSDQNSENLTPFVVTSVTCEGPLQSKSELPSLRDVICEAHEDVQSKHIVTQGYALYEIVSPLSADTTQEESCDSSYIAVECSWSKVKKIMESPYDASCKVLIRAVPGDTRSTPLAVYKELSTLVMFASSLETGEVSWTTREGSGAVPDLIKTFLQEVKHGPVYKRKKSESEEGDSQACWRSAFDRSDLDFTERLWVILKDNASCYADIKTAFAMVIEELNRGELQPMLHSRNRTILAQEIRAMYQDPTHVLDLDHPPMVLLVDIAINKFQRDYTNFFLAQKLTTLHCLEWYIPSDDLLTTRDRVTRLQSLHSVLELVMVASQSLGLPTTNILTLIRTALEYYRGNSPESQHIFALPVEQTSILHLYKNQLPTVWRLTTSQSGGRGDKMSCVYQLSTTPHLDCYPPNDSGEVTMDGGDEQDAFHYYVTRVRRDVT